MCPPILRQGAFVLGQQNHHVPEGHPVPIHCTFCRHCTSCLSGNEHIPCPQFSRKKCVLEYPEAGRTRLIVLPCFAFRLLEDVGPWVFTLCFGALYYPYSLTSYALRQLFPSVAQGSLPVVRLTPFRTGFPPAYMSCPYWAHRVGEWESGTIIHKHGAASFNVRFRRKEFAVSVDFPYSRPIFRHILF